MENEESAPALDSATLLTIWECGISQTPIRRALTLLSAAWPEKSADGWAQASVGKRDAGLLRLREELFGSRLEATARCPKCGEELELTLSTGDLRFQAADPRGPDENRFLEADGYRVRYRLPTSADLLEIAEPAVANKRQELLKRCIDLTQREGLTIDPAELPEEVVSRVADEMAQADPQAEVRIALVCPACQGRWEMVFDILSYLWNEIEDWARRLLMEIHTLAAAYGWSESQILGMSARRRRIYLEILGA